MKMPTNKPARTNSPGTGILPVLHDGRPLPGRPWGHRQDACATRGFTLIEVLLAVFILGIGLVMVACIFPVAADWSRQNAEESIASNIARNARTIILTKYAPSDFSALAADSAGLATLVALPGIASTGKLPLVERAYAYGAVPPYPAAAPVNALYFWTALVRRSPDVSLGTAPNRFDLYILVFKKGEAGQTFTPTPALVAPAINCPGTGGITSSPADSSNVPFLAQSTSISSIPIGSIGVGMTSGTVYRILPGPTTSVPLMPAGETIAYAPPADNTTASPLVFVYQTSISF